MRLGRSAHNLAQVSTLYREVQFFVAAVLFVLGWFVMSVVVFLRKDFGRNYVSWINLFFGYTAIGTFATWGNFHTLNKQPSVLIGLFYLSFIGLSIYHRMEANRKRKVGYRWHTEYSGTSLIPIPVSKEIMNKWIEPAVVFSAAVLMHLIHNRAMEAWLCIATIALLLHEHISYFIEEQKADKLADATIEAEYWKTAMQGKPARETHGFVIAQSTLDLLNRTPEVRDAFASLAPDIRKLMDDANETGRAA